MRHSRFVVYDAVCVIFLYRKWIPKDASVQDSSLTPNLRMLSFQATMFHAVSLREQKCPRGVEREFSMTKILNLTRICDVQAMLVQRSYESLASLTHPCKTTSLEHRPPDEGHGPSAWRRTVGGDHPVMRAKCIISGQAPPGAIAI